MKKTIFTLLMLCCISYTTSIANPVLPSGNGGIRPLVLTCHTVDPSVVNNEHHRTPVRVPNVYLNQETGTLLFDTPCYECTLELVVPGSDTTVYSAVIPDGADTFLLPEGFIGTYELHIHRGNFCFYGEIEL